VKSEVKLNEAK